MSANWLKSRFPVSGDAVIDVYQQWSSYHEHGGQSGLPELLERDIRPVSLRAG